MDHPNAQTAPSAAYSTSTELGIDGYEVRSIALPMSPADIGSHRPCSSSSVYQGRASPLLPKLWSAAQTPSSCHLWELQQQSLSRETRRRKDLGYGNAGDVGSEHVRMRHPRGGDKSASRLSGGHCSKDITSWWTV